MLNFKLKWDYVTIIITTKQNLIVNTQKIEKGV